MATFSASDFFHPGQNGKVFQHRPSDFIHSNAMNPFSKLIYGEKVMHSRYKLLILFAKSCASPWQLFSVIFIPSGSERKDFQHRLIHFIHSNAMNPFSKLTNGENVIKNRCKLLILFAKNCASPWQLFSVIFVPSGSERNTFPHRLIHFIHTNAMNPFS